MTQEAFYNGWKSGHYITDVFVFAPDSTLVMSMLNCPGAMHDSELASIVVPSMYHKIDQMYEKYGAKTVLTLLSACLEKSPLSSLQQRNVSVLLLKMHSNIKCCVRQPLLDKQLSGE